MRVVRDILGFLILSVFALIILSGMVVMAAQAIDYLARVL